MPFVGTERKPGQKSFAELLFLEQEPRLEHMKLDPLLLSKRSSGETDRESRWNLPPRAYLVGRDLGPDVVCLGR